MAGALANEVEELFKTQLERWAAVRTNYAMLAKASVRTFDVMGNRIVLQLNEHRIKSAIAKPLGDASECFLCPSGQPHEQLGLEWIGQYRIQVNPYPIFSPHFTVASLRHEPQRIEGRIAHMLQLAAELPGLAVLYNGPRCGASAPQHAHFQVIPQVKLPLPHAIAVRKATVDITALDDSLAYHYDGLRHYFVLQATRDDVASDMLKQLLAAMPVPSGDSEPMLNLLCWLDVERRYNVLVVPRRRHRAASYGSGDGQFLISPATVEMCGWIVAARHEDYDRLTAADVEAIFQDVCITAGDAQVILDKLSSR